MRTSLPFIVRVFCLVSVLVTAAPQTSVAQATKPPVVKNVDTRRTYTSLQAAMDDAEPNEPLNLTFSGTLRESVNVVTAVPAVTITGVGRNPTLDASGSAASAIYIFTTASVTLRKFTVTGGLGLVAGGTARGGGILYDLARRLTLVDMTIRDNLADVGGGIFIATNTGNPDLPPDIELAGRTVVRDNDSIVDGGGIAADPGTTLRISDRAAVRGNTAGKDGGGIFIKGSAESRAELALSVQAGVTANTAGGSGGGVCVVGNVNVTGGKKARISGNAAKGIFGGGGVYAFTTEPVGEGSELSFVGEIINNKADSTFGGGLVVTGRELTLGKGAKVLANTALMEGGGVYADNVLDFSECQIAGNRSLTDRGGGIILFGNPASPAPSSTLSKVKVTGNQASGGGGGIALQGSKLVLSESVVERNSASPVAGSTRPGGDGGGVLLREKAAIQVDGGVNSISSNVATTAGGGVSVTGESSAIFRAGTRISNNSTVQGAGGGIAVVGRSELQLEADVVISGNKAGTSGSSSADGGGIFFDSGKDLKLTGPGITIRNNEADQGGGIFAVFSGVDATTPRRIAGVDIFDNTARSEGGGMHLRASSGALELSDLAVSDNVADRAGGGIFLTAIGASVTASDLSVLDNIAGQGGGGLAIQISPATANQPSSLTITGGQIVGNYAKQAGGGMAIGGSSSGSSSPGSATVSAVRFEQNIADQDGGGVHASLPMTMSNCSIVRNIGRDGGGLALYPSGFVGETTYTLNATRVAQNRARLGGGIDFIEAFSFGVPINRAQLVLGAGTVITGNRASLDLKRDDRRFNISGGGIVIRGAQEIDCGPQVSGNSPNQISRVLNTELFEICP